jgi:hypothetical protein
MKVNLIIIHGLLETGIICPIKHLQLKQNESQPYHNSWVIGDRNNMSHKTLAAKTK